MGTHCVTVWRPLTKLLHWEGSETRPTIWMAITVLQWCDVILGWKVQQITVSLCRWCYNELSRPSISRLDWRRCSRGCWEFDSSAVVVMAEAAGAAGSCWCRGTMPEPPAALLHLFSIGHKLTPPPKHTHPPHTHTHARPAVPLSGVSTYICHAWQRWHWQAAIVACSAGPSVETQPQFGVIAGPN